MAFTPANTTQFAQGLAYYFGESGTLPTGGWTAAQVGTFADPATKSVIGTWDTKNVITMANAFNASAAAPGQPGRAGFNEDISSWNTSNVTSMANMFKGNPAFSKAIGGWDVSKVTDMSSMFDSSSSPSIFNEDIRSWNVSSVTTMEFMFRNAEDFTFDIRVWSVSPATDLNNMFNGAVSFLAAYASAPGWANLGQGTPTPAFFNYKPVPSQTFSFGGMPNKTPYTTNASFAMGRMFATRAYQSNPVPYKQFKTQNGGGTAGRLRRLKAQAAFGDATKTDTSVVSVPAGPTQVVVTTTEPNFGGADPNIVNAYLAKARNIGAAVPRNAIPKQ